MFVSNDTLFGTETLFWCGAAELWNSVLGLCDSVSPTACEGLARAARPHNETRELHAAES